METQKELRLYTVTSNINTVVSNMSCFVVVYFLIATIYLAFTSKMQVSKGLLTGDQEETEHFCFQSGSFVYAKVNESHPMHEQ